MAAIENHYLVTRVETKHDNGSVIIWYVYKNGELVFYSEKYGLGIVKLKMFGVNFGKFISNFSGMKVIQNLSNPDYAVNIIINDGSEEFSEHFDILKSALNIIAVPDRTDGFKYG